MKRNFSLHITETRWPPDEEAYAKWKELFDTSYARTIFSHPIWQTSLIQAYGDSDNLLMLWFYNQESKLVAMGLLKKGKEKGRITTYSVLRSVDANAQRIVPFLAISCEYLVDALYATWSLYAKEIDYIDFYKLDALEGSIQEISDNLTKRKVGHTLHIFNEQPVIHLENSWEFYLSGKTQGHRKKIKRYPKKIQELYKDCEYVHITKRDDIDQTALLDTICDEIFSLFSQSWQGSQWGEEYPTYTQFMKTIIRNFFDVGAAHIFLLRADNNLLAFEVAIADHSSLYMIFGAYNQTYRHLSPGNAILSHIILQSFSLKFKYIELGGDYIEYKRLWTSHASYSYALRLYGKSFRSSCKLWLLQTKERIPWIRKFLVR